MEQQDELGQSPSKFDQEFAGDTDDQLVVGELIVRCTTCRAQLDPEDLFCPNCGTEAPLAQREGRPKPPDSDWLTHRYVCEGCGASMSYDASAQTLRCPFCSSEKLTSQPDQKALRAKLVVPFQTTREQVLATLKQWMGSSFWRPSGLANDAVVTKVVPVYVPYWVFSARADTYWTADTNQVPWHARGDWRPLTGDHRGDYHGILVGASGTLTPVETSAICPFNLNAGQPLSHSDLDNFIVEQFRVQRKYARPLARSGIESFEREACRKLVPGRSRNVKVNVRLSDIYSEPVLLPVWILAYKYKGELYRFLVNGQTGRHTGTAPISWFKIMMTIGLTIVLVAIVLLLVTLFASTR